MDSHIHSIPFAISFGPSQWGWLPIELELDDHLYSFKASEILNNPIAEFLHAARNILDGCDSGSVINMWREPGWHSLILEPAADGGTVYISLLWNEDESLANPKACYESTATAVEVVRAIVVALEKVISQRDAYEVCSGWNSPDPMTELAEIQEMLLKRHP